MNIYLKPILIICFLSFNNIFVFSQNKELDSILNILKITTNEDLKIKLLYKVSREQIKKRHFNETLTLSKKGIAISKKNNNKFMELKFLNLISDSYYYKFKYDKSILTLNKIHAKSLKLNNNLFIGKAYQGYSKNYWRKGKLDKAVSFGTKALEIFEKLNDTTNIIISKGNLGTIYLDIQNYDKAMQIYDEILNSINIKNDTTLIANVYEKKGVVYFFKSDFQKARFFYNKSLKLYKTINRHLEVAIEYGNIAETYEMENEYKKAIIFYKKAIKKEEEFKYKSGLIFLYEAIGRSYFKINNYKKAKKSYLKSLELINESGESRELPLLLKLLYELYEKTGDYKNAYQYSKKAIQINDSISGVKVKNKINEIRIQYETEKNKSENEILKKNEIIKDKIIALQENKSKNQFQIILFISFFLLVISAISIFLYRLFRKTKKLSSNLNKSNKELKKTNENIEYSINYARKIQLALLASSEYVKEYFSDYFIMNKPQSIVSGDFYWARKINNTVFFAVGDCTGHGIPGAFLTIMGISLLNETVVDENIQTDEVLNTLREKIKLSLNQNSKNNKQLDGMDISFCSFNTKNNNLQFSGAYNSIYIKKANSSKEDSLQILKADRQPLNIFIKEKPFTKQNIKLTKSDILYLFSDGFSDQLNENTNKKYGSKRLLKFLFSISDKTMQEQNNILEKEFEDWRKNHEQVDDVLIMGIKI